MGKHGSPSNSSSFAHRHTGVSRLQCDLGGRDNVCTPKSIFPNRLLPPLSWEKCAWSAGGTTRRLLLPTRGLSHIGRTSRAVAPPHGARSRVESDATRLMRHLLSPYWHALWPRVARDTCRYAPSLRASYLLTVQKQCLDVMRGPWAALSCLEILFCPPSASNQPGPLVSVCGAVAEVSTRPFS